MARYDVVIESGEALKNFHLSCGFYETTYVLLKDEKMEIDIHYSGKITVFNEKNQVILRTEAPKSEGGRGIYMDCDMKVEDHKAIIHFPIYSWIDHYPHCDGESDRWSTKTMGYHLVTIDLKTLEVTIVKDQK